METIGESLYPKRSTKIFLFSSFLAFPYGAIFRLFQFLDNIAYAIIRQCLKYDVLLSSTKGYRRKGLKSLVFSHRMILVLFHPWRHERDASYRGQSVFIVVFAADLFILHAKGDENSAANKTERDDIESTYTRYKANSIYNAVLGYGNISDASVYSVLDNKSNYGDTHERQTADRTLTLSLSHGETDINTIATENENRQTIYTLQGTKTDHLPRGLYIQNGKKIIMK